MGKLVDLRQVEGHPPTDSVGLQILDTASVVFIGGSILAAAAYGIFLLATAVPLFVTLWILFGAGAVFSIVWTIYRIFHY